MIRPATLADIHRLVGWAQKFHAISGMAAPFDAEAVPGMLARMIESQDAVVLTSEHGAIGGVLIPAYCAPSWIIAVELFWWAEKDGLRLLRAFEEWAAQKGAQEVRMTSLSAQPRATEILSRRGYAAAEISHSKVI